MKKILILSLILIFITSTSFAEVISLKDGSTIKGQITKDTGEEITVKTDDKAYTIPWDKIQNVAFDGDTQQAMDGKITFSAPAKLKAPSEIELKIAQLEAYNSIKALNGEVRGLRTELEQIKTIMNIELTITIAAVVLAVISYFAITSQIK